MVNLFLNPFVFHTFVNDSRPKSDEIYVVLQFWSLSKEVETAIDSAF